MSPDQDDDQVRAAAAGATDAAHRAGVEVVDLHGQDDLQAASALFDAVWGRPGEAGAVLPAEALAAITHAGGQVTGAFRDGSLVGATAAFLGRHDDGRSFLHSHVTGVLDDATTRGVGAALKWHQRAWCLARDLGEVRWTFDPLIRRNVAFNLVRLGAQVVAYRDDAYGRMPDARNAGQPTDRFVASWQLTSPRVAAAAAGRAASPDVEALRRAGAEVALDELADGSPHLTVTAAARRLVRLPQDVERLRVTDPDLALAWAAAVRSAVGDAVRGGARVTGATRDGWLVLAAGPERVQDLTGGRG
ncbi:GNAT family N-acetyltransferase [Nitriliruptoraceae bacterium ZYF776]|nr:GNAT family N-acetyltransferase [Profundirhabdus halotolerans]